MANVRKPTIKVCITSLGSTKGQLTRAKNRLTQLSRYFEVEVDERIVKNDMFGSRPAKERLSSVQNALNNADIALAWSGGFNAIELLLEERFEKSRKSKAVFVGYSDNTILVNGLGQRALYGPTMDDYVQQTDLNPRAGECLYALFNNDFKTVSELYTQQRIMVVTAGVMEGKIIGGNNYSFSLLQGTKYCPNFNQPYILFMEGETILKNPKYIWRDFIRNIDSILLLPGARENLKGLLLGKFPEDYTLAKREVQAFVNSRPYLKSIPIVADVPCGHGPNSLYLPINQPVKITVNNQRLQFTGTNDV